MTAVEWLEQQLKDTYDKEGKLPLAYTLDLVKQAKQMEKEQIMNAWNKRCKQGTFISGWHIETQDGEQYYNETYGQEREYLKESTCEYSGLRSVQSYEDPKK